MNTFWRQPGWWGVAAMTASLAMLPGQNEFQTLTLTPGAPKVAGEVVELSRISDYPVLKDSVFPLVVAAQAAMAIDADSGAILFEKNPNLKLRPASTTKIMTALVAVDEFDLDEVVTVGEASRSIGQTADLVAGEQMTVENLLYALLVNSGNDAALALANHDAGGYDKFVERMNEKAAKLHLINTYYRNVSGVEQEGHLTTVRDLLTLTKEVVRQPTLAKIVATKEITIVSIDGKYQHRLVNLNQLLGRLAGITGVKTGWTELAGECLVASVTRDGRTVLTAILNSPDRFGETEKLIEWVFDNYEWKEFASH